MHNSIPQFDEFSRPEDVARVPCRPLGAVSDYAAGQLPLDIRDVRRGALEPSSFREFASSITRDTRIPQDLSPADAALARTDVMMLQQSLQACGAEPSESVHMLADRIAERRPVSLPSLSYEDLVLANPPDDPRTFHLGNVGRSELFFYGVHRSIESLLFDLHARLDGILQLRAESQFADECVSCLESIKQHMESLKDELSVADFGAMRGAFLPNQRRNIAGPSGKHSAGFYAIDSLLVGDMEEMSAFNDSKRREFGLFPVGDFDGPYASQDTMISVDEHLRKNNPTMRQLGNRATRAVLQGMLDVRKMHYQLYATFVRPGIAGTGGAKDVAAYLKIPLRIYADAVQASS